MPGRALTVGLTGGLASGKSTVLGVFAARGAATIDADDLAREALAPGSPLLPRVRALLGDSVLDAEGGLDRRRTAAIVFADAGKRRALEALVHPEVIRREEELTARHAAAGAHIVVVDAALLVEIGRHTHFDRLVVVACPPEVQLARAVARGMDPEDARRRIASQLPLAEKAALADDVVDTGGTLAETSARALAVFARLEEDAALLRAGQPLPPRRLGPLGGAGSAGSAGPAGAAGPAGR